MENKRAFELNEKWWETIYKVGKSHGWTEWWETVDSPYFEEEVIPECRKLAKTEEELKELESWAEDRKMDL